MALEAHVVVARAQLGEIEQVKRALKARLRRDFDVEHATLEIELGTGDAATAGHDTSTIPQY